MSSSARCPTSTVLNIFSFASEEGNAILEINPGIAYTVIDRMLRRKGAPPGPPPLTRIERALMTRIAGLALRDLGEAWSSLWMDANAAQYLHQHAFQSDCSPG